MFCGTLLWHLFSRDYSKLYISEKISLSRWAERVTSRKKLEYIFFPVYVVADFWVFLLLWRKLINYRYLSNKSYFAAATAIVAFFLLFWDGIFFISFNVYGFRVWFLLSFVGWRWEVVNHLRFVSCYHLNNHILNATFLTHSLSFLASHWTQSFSISISSYPLTTFRVKLLSF